MQGDETVHSLYLQNKIPFVANPSSITTYNYINPDFMGITFSGEFAPGSMSLKPNTSGFVSKHFGSSFLHSGA